MFSTIDHRFGNSQENFKRMVYKAKQQKYKILLEEEYIQPQIEEVHKEIWELYDNDDVFNKHNPNTLCSTEYNIDKVNTEKEIKTIKTAINFLDITKKAVKNKYEKKY